MLLHRARPKIKIVSTKSNVVVGDLLSLYPIVRECVRIVFVKKMRRFILHINKNIYFCIARGEKSLGQECVSCFIPYIEIANFKQRDEDNVTLILFVYHRYSPRCTYMVYTTAWGICFSVHFSMVFGDTRFTMSATSLYAFLVWYHQTQLLIC